MLDSVLDLPLQFQLRKAISQGLPLTLHPYQTLAEQLGCSESAIFKTLSLWQKTGLVKRFGVVVKHRSLGYCANAMVVWNVPDNKIDDLGKKLSVSPYVTLCYQRPRVLPEWPYNLFTMIHGKDRASVVKQIDALIESHQLFDIKHDVLFSFKAYKQCGGQYGQVATPVIKTEHRHNG